ncbi:MAM and LDL-receptor class A domain-containing protein 1-like [Dendronephthya gigantea]|uniref:MAM and LDL-receptor class A domain-containing protein 1-like n=1 Tax=Dendronephthya gigantea TaxID=151771 RepID=UPI0010694CEE|nr:MAM and LDL-receptor class A domain-containing protein 1-like [Dendronephthya gigantea]
MDNNTKKSVFLTHPIELIGRYSIECLGLFCGDCPLAIFIHFSGYTECVVTSSRSIPQTKTISLRILKNILSFPGLKSVQMGYKTDGDCKSLKMNMGKFVLSESFVVQEIGKIDVKPLALIACYFAQSRLCQIGTENNAVFLSGWSPSKVFNNIGHKVNALTMSENMIARFTYDGVPYNWVIERTGVCIKFRYKSTGDNNTLSLSFKTSSAPLSLRWSLHGNHGDVWKTGSISHMPNESFAFTFGGRISETNSTVAIASLLITTEVCTEYGDIYPYFADPDSKCDSNKFLCDNGECISHSYVCDGDKRCSDGSDEKKCECFTGQFRCLVSGECIEKRFLCDGIDNCGDASDEKDCYKSCDSKQFYCPSGICIPWNTTCNGVRDCLDGADEPSICGNTTANKTCSLDNLSCMGEMRPEEMCDTNANCDFEEGSLCEWHQVNDGSDDFDWSIGKGETASKNTGPIVDRTTRSKEGSYIFIEASSPRVAGDKAILNSGPFKPDRNFCFMFYYHMFGPHIGRLSVYRTGLNKTDAQVLWTRNASLSKYWNAASIDIESKEAFYLFFEAVRGDGSQGDIGLDDISMVAKNCSEVHNDYSPFCSFEKPCPWKMTPKVWSRMRVKNRNLFMLRDHFLMTRSSGRMEIVLSEQITDRRYQCMSFWYKFSYTTGMQFRTMQLFDWNIIQLWHSLQTANKQWVFGEMPLRVTVMKSKLVIIVTIPSKRNSPYFAIDEINFSKETCLSFQQGGFAWIRKSSTFYKWLKKRNSDGSITAFYDRPNIHRALTAQSFLKKFILYSINHVVNDIPPSEYTNISLGSRILIKDHHELTAVAGIVIAKETVGDNSRYLLTARLDINGTDVVVEEERALLLPYQLDRIGSAWLSLPVYRCRFPSYNDWCYFSEKKRNWFDGADECKLFGGEMAKFDSELEEIHARNIFANLLPFWIGYHGHKHQGKRFVWSDGKKDLYNNLDKRSLDQGLSAGLCVTITNSTVWERRNCSEVLNVVCRIPVVRKILISKQQGKKTLNCSNLDAVIDILDAKLDPVQSKTDKGGKSSGKTTYCKLKPDVSIRVKTRCQFKNWCRLSVKSIINGNCPDKRYNLMISYRCEKNSKEINPGTSEFRSVFCPKDWDKFRTSCYILNWAKIEWDKALTRCESMVLGASLVSFDDKKEKDYIRSSMKSKGSGSCDFETDWCGWSDYSNNTDSRWYRTVEQEPVQTSMMNSDIARRYQVASPDKVNVYLFRGRLLEEVYCCRKKSNISQYVFGCFFLRIIMKPK